VSASTRTWARADASGPLVIGHRGASAREPENSQRAFARAARDGADGVELDVLCCRSGEVLVFHDDDLLRLSGRPERIDALPFSELRTVTLSGGVKIPTLAEAFEACGPDLLVNVELKTNGLRDRAVPALVERVSDIIDETGTARRVLVSSFSPVAVWLWRRRRPDVKAGLLFEREASLPLRRAWSLPLVGAVAAHPDQRLCTPALIRRLHARGYLVNTWTVDEPARLRALRDLGIDGVITNDPAAARAALRQSPAPSPSLPQ
jgi:glycerophosphoryl diester phosphodiesterase